MIIILLLKVFITSKFKFRVSIKNILVFGFIMISSAFTYGQQSVDFFGASQSPLNSKFRLSSLESSAHNFTLSKDWEISASFSGVKGKDLKTNLLSFSIAKKLGVHYIFARYTPGYLKEFIFSSGTKIILSDSQKVLQKRFRYNEEFGLGYSFRFSSRFSAGFSNNDL